MTEFADWWENSAFKKHSFWKLRTMSAVFRNPAVLWKPGIDLYEFEKVLLVCRSRIRKCCETRSSDKTRDCLRVAQCRPCWWVITVTVTWLQFVTGQSVAVTVCICNAQHLTYLAHFYSTAMDFLRVLDPSKLVLTATVSHTQVILQRSRTYLFLGHRLLHHCFHLLPFVQFAHLSLWMLCTRERWSPTVAPIREQCAIYKIPSSFTNRANH